MIEYRLSCIIRAAADGTWFIQDDIDHHNEGFATIDHLPDCLRLNFQSDYDKAGTIQICTDDGFGGSIEARGNLGLSSSLITIRAHPNLRGTNQGIDPRRIWDCLPDHTKGGGNLWINVTMWRNA